MVPRRYAGPAARGTFFARPATPGAADAQAWGSWVQRMLFLGYWGQVPSQSPMIKPFAVVSYFRMRSAPLVQHVDRALPRMAQSNSRAALSSSAPSGTLHLCCDSSLSRSVAWRLPSIYGHVAKKHILAVGTARPLQSSEHGAVDWRLCYTARLFSPIRALCHYHFGV